MTLNKMSNKKLIEILSSLKVQLSKIAKDKPSKDQQAQNWY